MKFPQNNKTHCLRELYRVASFSFQIAHKRLIGQDKVCIILLFKKKKGLHKFFSLSKFERKNNINSIYLFTHFIIQKNVYVYMVHKLVPYHNLNCYILYMTQNFFKKIGCQKTTISNQSYTVIEIEKLLLIIALSFNLRLILH